MLEIIIPSSEFYDELKEEFITSKEQILHLEHSLVSLSKWESKWHKPFISKDKKTTDETIDYIKCMTLNKNVDINCYYNLSDEHFMIINNYIDDDMTATKITKQKGTGNRGIITSEIIYYCMIAMNIPFECQKWHLNRLLTLIDVCDIKNNPPKKMGKKELLSRNAQLNAQRKQALNTKG